MFFTSGTNNLLAFVVSIAPILSPNLGCQRRLALEPISFDIEESQYSGQIVRNPLIPLPTPVRAAPFPALVVSSASLPVSNGSTSAATWEERAAETV